jgi:hypothetical protein
VAARGDIDLLPIGEQARSEISMPLSRASERLGRHVSLGAYSPDEFSALSNETAARLRSPKRPVHGTR